MNYTLIPNTPGSNYTEVWLNDMPAMLQMTRFTDPTSSKVVEVLKRSAIRYEKDKKPSNELDSIAFPFFSKHPDEISDIVAMSGNVGSDIVSAAEVICKGEQYLQASVSRGYSGKSSVGKGYTTTLLIPIAYNALSKDDNAIVVDGLGWNRDTPFSDMVSNIQNMLSAIYSIWNNHRDNIVDSAETQVIAAVAEVLDLASLPTMSPQFKQRLEADAPHDPYAEYTPPTTMWDATSIAKIKQLAETKI